MTKKKKDRDKRKSRMRGREMKGGGFVEEEGKGGEKEELFRAENHQED